MSLAFNKCIERRSLVKTNIDVDIIKNEIKSAEYDLEKAKISLKQKDFKWSIIKAYYTIFHSAKALVYKKGYKEKSHYCLLVAVKHLYCGSGELDPIFSQMFEDAMSSREEADYEFKFSEATSEIVVKDAEKFLDKTKTILQPKM